MKCSLNTSPHVLMLVMVLTTCVPARALAQSAVKFQTAEGTIQISADGPSPFILSGIASHLGRFISFGEANFLPGETEGSLVGEGVVVFTAANGDALAGVVTLEIGPEDQSVHAAQIHFSWRDAVELSNGAVVLSTGRFVNSRPPGAIIQCEVRITFVGSAPVITVQCR
jgi:hypothetical protein